MEILSGTKIRVWLLKDLLPWNLFYLYKQRLRCSAKVYADSTSLFPVIKDVNESAKKLNKYLENITNWVY